MPSERMAIESSKAPSRPAEPLDERRPTIDDDDDAKTIARPSPAAASDGEAALAAMRSFRLAESALQRNDLAAAAEHANKALAAEPSQPDYIVLVAWITSMSGGPSSVEKSIRTMSNVLLDDPANQRALLYRGRLLVRTNRPREALLDFEELLSTNPNHREAQAEVRQLTGRIPQS
jgi:tetratricopeptide (TPR) repeat protein